jgi:cell wall-associated NlpC family hydrolase
MSIESVTDRIQQIETQISQLQSYEGTDAATTAAFSTTLDEATSATATSKVALGSTDGTGTSSTTPATTSQQAVVDEAKEYVGLPYVWGGTSKTSGVDCSGLVQSVYKSLGYDLPRLSADQARSGRAISSMADAQPGDLIAWDNSSRNNGADHIAIYIGDGKMIEAPRTGLKVRIVDVPSTPDYIRRILPDSTSSGTASRTAVSSTTSTASAASASSLGSLAASRASFDLQTLRSAFQEGAA